VSPKLPEEPAPDMTYVIYLRGVNVGMGYYDKDNDQWHDKSTGDPIQTPDEWYPLKKQPQQ